MRHFEELLQELLQRVVVMGSMVESMVDTSVRILFERNLSLAAEVVAKEQEVNALQVEIDDKAVKLTALQQPMASDARFLFMASRICGELERIGDQAINITQNARFVLRDPPLKPMVDLPAMAEAAQKMVRDALNAMITREAKLAEQVLEEENKVDAYRDKMFRMLLTYMMADPGTIQRALALILISRNIERIGDHASNIAEEVIYWIQGRDIRHSKSRPAPGPAASPAESQGGDNGHETAQGTSST